MKSLAQSVSLWAAVALLMLLHEGLSLGAKDSPLEITNSVSRALIFHHIRSESILEVKVNQDNIGLFDVLLDKDENAERLSFLFVELIDPQGNRHRLRETSAESENAPYHKE